MKSRSKIHVHGGGSYTLLSIGADTKTVKGAKHGWLTAVMYLVPAGQMGFRNLCPKASPGCRQGCLFTAGRGQMPGVAEARARRTQRFISDRPGFLSDLNREIVRAQGLAEHHRMRLAVRLNGTSDIPWEKFGVPQAHPDLQFYDYTKDNFRMVNSLIMPDWPANYSLSFSRSEKNWMECEGVLELDGNVVAVFDKVPGKWKGYRVIDGDKHDLRFLDPGGVIVGVKAKGRARLDTTGFVIRMEGGAR